jgi:hypothetical protein
MSKETDKIKADLAKVKELAASIGLSTTPAGKNNANVQMQNNTYGITLALANAYPEIMSAWKMLLANNYAGAEQAILNSSFYKNNSAAARERLQSKVDQPGVYADNLERYILTTRERLVKAGVKLDDMTLRSIAAKAFDSGMDDNQVDQLVIQSGKTGTFGGSILTGIQALKSYATDFGVSYDKKWWDAQSTKLFTGETTAEDIQQSIRDTAKSAFPAYADGFDKGLSLAAQTSSKKASIARLLEVDPDTITVENSPVYRQAIQYVDPATGKPAQQPDWMTETNVRKTAAWRLTDNARATVGSLMLQPITDWGL